MQSFTVNTLDQLTGAGRSGRLTVAGTSSSAATNVTVNTSNALLYADYTFASTNHNLANGTNTFTAVAWDSLGRVDTNVARVYLPETVSYTYDANGNLLSDGRRHLSWDDENQLIQVILTNALQSGFVYDGKGRRRIRTEAAWNGSVWVTNAVLRYVYDGNLVLQERDQNNVPRVTYTRGRDLSGSLEGAGGIGGLLARTDHGSGQTAFYHADGNGNVTALVNAQQAIVARYHHDPFGNILSLSGPLAEANLYRFSSKELHEPSGLVYYLYRYYDPNLQRWPNRDPLGELGFAVASGYGNGFSEARNVIRDPLTGTAVDILEKSRSLIVGLERTSYIFVDNDGQNHVDAYGLIPEWMLFCGNRLEWISLGAVTGGLGFAFAYRDKYLESFYGELIEPGECIYARSPTARLIGTAGLIDLSGQGTVWKEICKDKKGKVSSSFVVIYDSPSA